RVRFFSCSYQGRATTVRLCASGADANRLTSARKDRWTTTKLTNSGERHEDVGVRDVRRARVADRFRRRRRRPEQVERGGDQGGEQEGRRQAQVPLKGGEQGPAGGQHLSQQRRGQVLDGVREGGGQGGLQHHRRRRHHRDEGRQLRAGRGQRADGG